MVLDEMAYESVFRCPFPVSYADSGEHLNRDGTRVLSPRASEYKACKSTAAGELWVLLDQLRGEEDKKARG